MQGKVDLLKNAHRKELFTVETVSAAHALSLSGAFPDAVRTADDTLVFSGGEDRLNDVLQWIVSHKLSVRRIERAEPSLESLFLEVIAK